MNFGDFWHFLDLQQKGQFLKIRLTYFQYLGTIIILRKTLQYYELVNSMMDMRDIRLLLSINKHPIHKNIGQLSICIVLPSNTTSVF